MNENNPEVNRKIKDSVFTDLFKDKKNILRMYRELHPEDKETTEDDITTITLTHVIVNKVYNDLGFQVKNKLIILVEAQSTWSVNIIIRLLIYLVQTYQEYIHKKKLYMYSSKRMELPVPEMYVIYTGERKDIKEKISIREDLFPGVYVPFDVEAKVITAREKGIIHEYIMFVKIYTEHCRKCKTKEEAIRETIRICKDKDILKEYLSKRESEVYSMLNILFDQEYQEEAMRLDSYREGEEKGIEKGIEKGREEGIEKGREEGRKEVLYRLIKIGTSEPIIISLGYTEEEYNKALKEEKKAVL